MDLSPKSIRFAADVAMIEIESTAAVGVDDGTTTMMASLTDDDDVDGVASTARNLMPSSLDADKRYRIASESDTGAHCVT